MFYKVNFFSLMLILAGVCQPVNAASDIDFFSLVNDSLSRILRYSVTTPTELFRFTRVNRETKNAVRAAIAEVNQRGEVFDFSRIKLTKFEFKVLFTEQGLFSRIKKLKLGGIRFNSDIDFDYLSNLPVSLEDLDLMDCQIKDADIQKLYSLTRLVTLNLSKNNLGNEGAKHIARMKGVSHLYLAR